MVAVLKPFPARYVAKYIGTRATHFKALRWSPWRQCDKKKCECYFVCGAISKKAGV